MLLPVLDGKLGHGIKIGGSHEGFELHAGACDWTKHPSGVQVRSGWFYSDNNAGPYLAVAFFKITLSPDGTGYIHICDASSPPHTLWLTTDVDRHKHSFHYQPIGGVIDARSSAIWDFRWKD